MEPVTSGKSISSFETNVSIDCAKNLQVLFETILDNIKQTASPVVKVIKATLVVPFFVILTIVTTCIVFLGFLYHLATLPLALFKHGWNKQTFLTFFLTCKFELFSLTMAIGSCFLNGTDVDTKILTNSKVPILCIHGYLHSSAAWNYFRKSLEQKKTCGDIFSINAESPFKSIKDFAENIYQKLLEIRKITGSEEIILLGHSMGGIAASYLAVHLNDFMKENDPKIIIRTVITLGSPLKGTKIAKLGLGECAREMEYESEFLIDLEDRIQNASQIQFLQLGSSSDLIVRPTKAAFTKKCDHITQHEFTNCGHITYLFSDTVIDTCSVFLQRDEGT